MLRYCRRMIPRRGVASFSGLALLLLAVSGCGSADGSSCAPGLGTNQIIKAAESDPALTIEPPGTVASEPVESQCSADGSSVSGRVDRVYRTSQAVNETSFIAEAGVAGGWTQVGSPSDPKDRGYCWVKSIDGSLSTLRVDVEGEQTTTSISLGESALLCSTAG